MRNILVSTAAAAALSFSVQTQAAPTDEQFEQLQQQIDQLQTQLDNQQQELNTATSSDEDGINIGGAVRFQYSNTSYDNNHQKGGIAFDTFRLNVDGKKGDMILNAEWRWYEYMTTLQRAWVGYNFDENNQGQVGLVLIPFGNQTYNSNSFFFSSNYYIGLEDNHAFGGKYIFNNDQWNLQAAFLKNAARGVTGGNSNYSYDLVKNDTNTNVGTVNSGVLRLVYKTQLTEKMHIEAGASGLYGQLSNGTEGIGNYGAYAAHSEINYSNFNFKLQATTYDYRFNNGEDIMVLGAYAVDYPTPTSADTYSAAVSYHIPVNLGPITAFNIYNDFSMVNHKAGGFDKTTMNDFGIGISAGGVYAYIDYIAARNQPFIGDTFVDNGDLNHRFNFNVGYYF